MLETIEEYVEAWALPFNLCVTAIEHALWLAD